MKLIDKNAIITGANQGLGRAIAHAFVCEGASVVICARDLQKLSDVEKELVVLASKNKKNQQVVAVRADVSSEKDVAALVKTAISKLKRIDIVVNNAGIYGPKGNVETLSSKEWIDTFNVNVFGVLFVTQALLPHMKKNKYGKIINLSGGGASPVTGLSAYTTSKAAIGRFTECVAVECKIDNIDVNAIAPGALNTRLLSEILAAGPAAVGKDFYEKSLKQKESGGIPLEKAASLCVYLASSKSDGISGRIISAVWDPWDHLEKFSAEISASDIYTLRRIVPEDRNKKWV